MRTHMLSRSSTQAQHHKKVSGVPNIGLRVDQAALNWLQQHPESMLFSAIPAIHPLVFIRQLLSEIHFGQRCSLKSLLRESHKYRAIPSQHLNDHHFSRSLKYLSDGFGMALANEPGTPLPGDLLIFTRTGAHYCQVLWAVCGSAGRLYHIDNEQQRVVCSFLQHERSIKHVITVSPCTNAELS